MERGERAGDRHVAHGEPIQGRLGGDREFDVYPLHDRRTDNDRLNSWAMKLAVHG